MAPVAQGAAVGEIYPEFNAALSDRLIALNATASGSLSVHMSNSGKLTERKLAEPR
jgi:hypothetical protein